MPWKVMDKVEERRKFVTRILQGEKMTEVCREFEISRKTGYKIYDRFMEFGYGGLDDASRRPKHLANLLESGIASIILKLKSDKPTWGAPKLRELFTRKHPNICPPAISTIHALLDRNGLVKHRKKRNGYKARGTYLSVPKDPNDLWCTDFKGQFPMGNQSLCYPLTVTDQVSRFLLGIEAMNRISEDEVITSFKGIFSDYGLPGAIRSDNGVPFASQGLFGLSRLSVWWLRLGIKLERITPGKPQQNGQHERMHRTLKQSVTKPPASNLLAQQEKFDDFIDEFNNERPHEALAMKTPVEVYKPSQRPFPKVLGELDYPMHDLKRRVKSNGTIILKNKKQTFIGTPLRGQDLGLTELDSDIWEVCFMDYLLGFFDTQSYKFTPSENPFTFPTQ